MRPLLEHLRDGQEHSMHETLEALAKHFVLQGVRTRKGIFITTSDFSKEAEDYAAKIDSQYARMNRA